MRSSALFGAFLALTTACSAGADAGVPALDAAGEPLRAQFDAAAGKPRAIFLAAPT